MVNDDEPDMKQKILLAAMEEFADLGYRGATLRSIAGKVGATAALVNYHYGSKARLAEAVIEAERKAIGVPEEVDVTAITSEEAWRAALKSFIDKAIDVFTSPEVPNRYFAALYRHEAAAVSNKGFSLHDTCLLPVYRQLERLVALGVPAAERHTVPLWSVSLWNLVLAYALKDPRRVGAYIPEGMAPETFRTVAVDFMVDRVLGLLHYVPDAGVSA